MLGPYIDHSKIGKQIINKVYLSQCDPQDVGLGDRVREGVHSAYSLYHIAGLVLYESEGPTHDEGDKNSREWN